MRKLIGAVFALLALLLALSAFSGCGHSEDGGTEAGNPGNASGPGNSGSLMATQAAQILNAICAKLVACNSSLTSDSCAAGVQGVTNLGASFGLTGSYATDSFQTIENAEASGAITPSPSAAGACIAAIDALACPSAAVTSAYSNSSPAVFTNVVNLIPSPSCAGVF